MNLRARDREEDPREDGNKEKMNRGILDHINGGKKLKQSEPVKN